MSEILEGEVVHEEKPATSGGLVRAESGVDGQIGDLQSQGFLKPLSDEQKEAIRAKAVAIVDGFRGVSPQSKAFQDKISAIQSLAENEVSLTGRGASRLLSKQSSTLRSAKNAGNDASAKAHQGLSSLDSLMKDIAGRDKNRLFGIIPVPISAQKQVERMAAQTATAETKIKSITEALYESEDELAMDSAALEIEMEDLLEQMGKLHENIELAETLDLEVSEQVKGLREEGRDLEADQLEKSVMFAIRQRKQDLMTQLGVAAQSHMAMGIIRVNNNELKQGVKRARTTTITILQNTMTVHEALATQQKVLAQVKAVRKTTDELMLSTAKQLQSHSASIYQQSIEPEVAAETLKASFDAVFTTINDMAALRERALPEITQQVESIQKVLGTVQPRMQELAAVDAARSQSRLEITGK